MRRPNDNDKECQNSKGPSLSLARPVERTYSHRYRPQAVDHTSVGQYDHPALTDWRAVYAIDTQLLQVARFTANAVSEAFRPFHMRSHKLNMMLTINLDDVAEHTNSTPSIVFQRIMQLGRNVFRGRRHWFAGFWRREYGTRRRGGNHCHIVFHCPRGLMPVIARRLSQITADPIASVRSQTASARPRQILRGIRRSWDLRRVHNLPNLLLYVSKVPRRRDGTPISRSDRMRGHGDNVKEFRAFGVKRKQGR